MLDLAIVNSLGSNLFNVLIVALDDLFLTSGALLSSVNTGSRLVSVLAVLVMNALLLIGLSYQAPKKQLVLAWDTADIAGLSAGGGANLCAAGNRLLKRQVTRW